MSASSPSPRVGTDLVHIPRFARALARRQAAWRRRVFADAEWEQVARRPDRDAALAVRFAAKEALMKALGTGWGHGFAWRDVEIRGGGRARVATLALPRVTKAAPGRAPGGGVGSV